MPTIEHAGIDSTVASCYFSVHTLTCRLVHAQDKKALEDRLKEVQNILETVQNQRNELRQQYKEEKTARESLEAQLAAARQQGDYDLNAAKENAAQNIGQLVSAPA